jgi:hypothetical protein
MTDITIPPETLEAARTAFANSGTADDAVDPIHAACLAMLKAWPGMECRPTFTPSRIILPLTQENNNGR